MRARKSRGQGNEPVGGNCRESVGWINIGVGSRATIEREQLHQVRGAGICGGAGTLVRGEIAGVVVLFQEHGQVLRHGVPEVRAEHANVIASSVAKAHDGFRGGLISNTKAWGKGMQVVFDIAAQAVRADSSDADSTGSKVYDVGESSVAFAIHRLGEVNLPAQAVVEG